MVGPAFPPVAVENPEGPEIVLTLKYICPPEPPAPPGRSSFEQVHAVGDPPFSPLLVSAFAEFIVGTAIEFDNAAVRDEWGAYDLESKKGIKNIEVKRQATFRVGVKRITQPSLFRLKHQNIGIQKMGCQSVRQNDTLMYMYSAFSKIRTKRI